MNRRRLAALALGSLMMFSHNVLAQANVPTATPIDYGAARSEAERPPVTGNTAVPASEEVRRVVTAQADYTVWSLEYRQSVFWWQYWSTMMIFACVIALITCGLYFSYTQFKGASTHVTQTSIKLGKDGLEISSPVIGLLVLFLSLGFFYLYLTNVYPINEVGAGAASRPTAVTP